jgi:hypothetical protein
MINKKICSKCKIEKYLDDFYKQKDGYLGRRADCKECSKTKIKEWHNKNPKYCENYLLLHPEKRKIYSKKYYNNNKYKCLKYRKEYYTNNTLKLNNYSKNYYKLNKNNCLLQSKIWRNNNRDKCREYAKNRYNKSIELAAIKWMRNFLYRTEKQGFKLNKINVVLEFGYSPKQLIQRIECQFKDGMSWENRNKWHIDHKKPISKFSINTSMKTINMLSNLQPIWKTDNLSKGNKF